MSPNFYLPELFRQSSDWFCRVESLVKYTFEKLTALKTKATFRYMSTRMWNTEDTEVPLTSNMLHLHVSTRTNMNCKFVIPGFFYSFSLSVHSGETSIFLFVILQFSSDKHINYRTISDRNTKRQIFQFGFLRPKAMWHRSCSKLLADHSDVTEVCAITRHTWASC